MSDYFLIPCSTVRRVIELLESLDDSCIPDFWGYLDLLGKLKLEMCRIDIRVTYEKIVQAGGIELRRYESCSLISQIAQPIINDLAGG